MSGYIYIRENELCKFKNIVKLGITSISPKNREYGYTTYEHKRGNYIAIYEINLKHLKSVDLLLKQYFKQYCNYIDCGTEYYSPIIIDKIEPYLKLIGIKSYKYTQKEMDNIQRDADKEYKENKFKKIIQSLKDKGHLSIFLKKIRQYKKAWQIRDYQVAAIEHGYELLLQDSKFYLELPTGGGKSYIVYNILKRLISYTHIDLILIISPRRIVNSQNVSEKYLKCLGNNCNVYNYSNGNIKRSNEFFAGIRNNGMEKSDFNLYRMSSNILIICTSSIDKIYDQIKDLNICIWFDEAHYGVESWLAPKSKMEKKIAEQKTTAIKTTAIKSKWFHIGKYNIFTSASPDKNIIKKNKDTFGELYNPIKVNELIKLNWLCPIIPYVYMEDKKYVNKVQFMLNNFTDKNRKFGFSFHNSQANAFELFYFHYLEYIYGKTIVKPFLLIGDDFFTTSTKSSKASKEDNKEELLKVLSTIDLDYDYKDINVFQSNINSIGYVVAKYSMGYDFNLLDFIAFNDPKLSFKDIIQCIGRGIRPDCLGINGENVYKYLMILLPIYGLDTSSSESENKYHNIKKILQYLLNDIELNISDIWFIDRIEEEHKAGNKEEDKEGDKEEDKEGDKEEEHVKYYYYKYDEKYRTLGSINVLSTVLNLLENKKENRLDVKNYDFTNSIILSAKLLYLGEEHIPPKLKYKTIRDIIYRLINDIDQIIKYTTVNIIKEKKNDRGFDYMDDLQISVQGVDSNKCINEIAHQCIKNEINIIMEIKLKNNEIINIEY